MEAMNLPLLGGGLLVFVSLLAGVFSTRFGLSFLLVFLVAGMLVGEDGPGGIKFDSPMLAAWVELDAAGPVFSDQHAGEDRPGGIKFDSPMLAAWVGNASLA